jgi:hypothetical protein
MTNAAIRCGAVSPSFLSYLFGRNQQCTIEWIDDASHEGAAVLAAKLAAYKATTVESRFR